MKASMKWIIPTMLLLLMVGSNLSQVTAQTGTVLFRVNAGGPEIAATDSGPVWGADTIVNNSPYLSVPGSNQTYPGGTGPTVTLDASVPSYVPVEIFSKERYDADTTASPEEMQYSFPVAATTEVEIRLYFAEIFLTASNNTTNGPRIFDVSVDGTVPAVLDDIDQFALHGHDVGFMISYTTISDGSVDLEFIHVEENPNIKGIEIIEVTPPTNNPPSVTISTPPDNANFDTGESITFSGTANDVEDGDVTASIEWSSDLDGVLGTGASIAVSDLSVGEHVITATATDTQSSPGSDSITITVLYPAPTGTVLFRVNSGGQEIPALDSSGVAWSVDTTGNNSQYLVEAGNNKSSSTSAPITFDASVPAYVPEALFQIERWEGSGTAEMLYSFPVAAGTQIEIRLYFGEIYGPNSSAGSRIFDVSVDGTVPSVFDDIDQGALHGLDVGFMRSYSTTSDGSVDLEFLSSVENPNIKGIEIIELSTPSNTPPTVTIDAPADGSNFDEGVEITFEGTASDAEDTALDGSSIAWSSDQDGPLGTGASIAVSDLSVGEHVITAEVTDSGSLVGNDSITVIVNEVVVVEPANFCVNVNGVTGTAFGREFLADNADFYTGSSTFGGINNNATENIVTLTGVSLSSYETDMFQTERFGGKSSIMVIDLGDGNNLTGITADGSLPNGDYIVDLYFAEIFQGVNNNALNGGVGDRIFDVTVEGNLFLDDLDLFAVPEPDGPLTALVFSTPVTVADGSLTIEFDASEDNAKISAFCVTPADSDTEAPQITLLGDDPLELLVGDTYEEPGATATDNVNGDANLRITVDASAVDTGTADSYDVIYTATDAAGNSVQATRVVNVSAPNTAPEIAPIADVSVDEGDAISVSVDVTDNEGDATVSIEIVDDSDSSVVDGSNYSFDGSTLTWNNAPVGSYTATVTAEDGEFSDSESFAITVNAVNTAPEIAPIADVSVDEGDAISVSVDVTDNEGDATVSIEIVDDSDSSVVDGSNYSFDGSTLTWNNAPVGSYTATVTAEDGEFSDSESFAITVNAVVDPDPSGILSDDFNDFNLNTNIWTLIDPVGDATLSFTGTNTPDAWLNLGVSEGVNHDVWQQGNFAPRVMQSANDTDFEIEVKFENQLNGTNQLYGILIEESEGNFLRFDFYSSGNDVNIFSAVFVNGTPGNTSNVGIAAGAPLWMRITRSGDDFTQSYSYDGVNFTEQRTITHSMTVSQVGAFVGNAGQNPAHVGQIDYFFNTAAPIDPEDGATDVVDDSGPLVYNIEEGASDVQAAVSWATDELATGLVEYGTDNTYSDGSVTLGDLLASQTATINGLTPDTTYLFRITATDAQGNNTVVDGLSFTTGDQPPAGSPVVDVWYGDTQTYTIGRAQEWCNILGNVSDPDGISNLTYSLNGAPAVPASVEGFTIPGVAGSPRLENTGDFNIEIDCDDLQSGTNQVIITATDGSVLPNETTKLVTLEYDPNAYWPETYNIDWDTLTSIEEISSVAHVVDGKWRLENGGLRVDQPGYDRLVAIGDMDWDDYEILVPITFNGNVNGGGAGVLMRWNGHTDDPTGGTQPKTGYYPLGAIGWLWNGELEFFTNRDGTPSNGNVTVQSGDQILMRMRVTTLPDGAGFYQIKVWEVGTTEPTDWQLEYTADQQENDPISGSLMLIVHQIDVTFGDVAITPIIPPNDNTPPVITDVVTAPNDVSAFISWTTDELATSVVNYGLDTNYGSTVDSLALKTSHTLELTGLQPNTTYFYEITSADANDNTASVTGSFTTAAEPVENSVESDDFNTCALDTSLWRFEDAGFGNASFELIGGGSGEATLNLTATAAQVIDAWNPAGPPRMVQDIPSAAAQADFQVEAKFNNIPADNLDDQGLVFWVDASNWIRFDVYASGGNNKVFVGETTTGGENIIVNGTVAPGAAQYLRVTRTGNQWTFEYSADGSTWIEATTITRSLSLTEVGLFVANPDGGEHTTSVDYFFDTDAPITPEDGDTNTITITPNGSGTASLSPDQNGYACGDTVEITAEPEAGWVFDSWTGDVSSTDNPLTVTVDGDLNLTANFVEGVVGVPQATVAINPGTGIDSSTFNGGFSITNESTEVLQITSFSIDLSSAMYPDMVFDPNGTAGDAAGVCFEATGSSGSTTGLVAPGDPCLDPFSSPFGNGGFYVLSADFTDFAPGETFTFKVDVDPTSIENATGTGSSGSVSGLELAGSVYTVTFSDGSILSGEIYRVQPNSNGGAENTLTPDPISTAPGLTILNTTPTTDGEFQDATIDTLTPTAQISGAVGSNVSLLVIESDFLVAATPSSPFEANQAEAVSEYDAVIGASGTVDIPLTLTQTTDSGLYYLAAVIVEPDGRTSALSDVWRLLYEPGTPEALIEINPDGNLNASTFNNNSFQITNNSQGDTQITSVSIDLSSGILPDMVFDPTGSGGDATSNCLTPNTGATATGFSAPFDPCVDPYSVPRNGGFDVLTIDFTDFDPGEQFFFTTDVDPNSIQGVSGAGNAGAVSGYELIGATITVTFDNGTTLIGSLYEDGSLGGAQAIVAQNATSAPSIAAQGVVSTPAIVNDPDQTIVITGTPGDHYSLLQMDTRLYIASGDDPFDVEPGELPFYANEAMSGKVVHNGVIDGDGTVEVPVSMLVTESGDTTPDGGLNYFIAVTSSTPYAVDQQVSQTSNVIVLKYEEVTNTAPEIFFLSNVDNGITVEEADVATVQASITDVDGNLDTVDVTGADFITVTDEGNGVYTIEFMPILGDAGNYTITVTATDQDGASTSDSFDLTVTPLEATTLTGSFTIQGLLDFGVELDVSLYPVGSTTPIYTTTLIASTGGQFLLADLDPGTYQVAIKSSNTLQRVATVTVVQGANSFDFGELRSGDVNGDNFVNSLDFSLLASSFNKAEGDPSYDARADLNGDGVVSSLDFSLLASNFNTAGEEPQP